MTAQTEPRMPTADGLAVVLRERREAVLTLTINRPAAANALDGAVSTALARALDEADSDPEIRVIVLTGAGDRFFCAGADVAALARGESVLPAHPFDGFGLGGCTERTISKPIIVAVNGLALGGGFELVLSADAIVADPSARFGFPEVKVGIFAGAGGVHRLSSWLPRAVASQMLLTGAMLDAPRAAELGLVGVVSQPGEALVAAQELAHSIAANAPLGVRATKQLLRRLDDDGRAFDESEDWARSHELRDSILSSNDAAEGMAALRERRAPVWTGS